jgi:hypothetical protein
MVRSAAAVPFPSPRWHKAFLAMLPAIVTHAKIAFRHLHGEARQDAIKETIANALVAFVRLVQLKKADLAYATPLARYAVAQINDGRKVGGHLNIKDVMSPYCQRRKKITLERLDHFDEEENAWCEAVVVDTRSAPVSDIVAFRCDFSDWLASLSRRDRRIAESLAIGNRTGDVAKRFNVSAGRVSQLRRELYDSWRQFVGDEPTPEAA